jgi:quercetin dioxygenase-like cupin family protein
MNEIALTYRDSARSLVGLPTSTQRAYKLERELKKLPQAELPISNHFAPGVYVGTMLIRKNTVLTGAVHKTQHLMIVAKGRILIDGDGGVREYRAGDVIVSKPGAKRVGLALEDTVFMNVHHNPDNETDYPTLIANLTESKFEDLVESKIPTLHKSHTKELEYVYNR